MLTTADAVAASVAAAGFEAPDVAVARIRAFDTGVWMAYRPDSAEFRRRRGFPSASAMSVAILDTLMDLPVAAPVPVGAAERRLLGSVPYGGVELSGTTAVRRLTAPLTPLLALVVDKDFDKGLKSASRFAAYCPRMLVLPELPGNGSYLLAQASFYGVGVATTVGGVQVWVEPVAVADWQPTPAWWRFCELVYCQVSGAGSVSRAPRARETLLG